VRACGHTFTYGMWVKVDIKVLTDIYTPKKRKRVRKRGSCQRERQTQAQREREGGQETDKKIGTRSSKDKRNSEPPQPLVGEKNNPTPTQTQRRGKEISDSGPAA